MRLGNPFVQACAWGDLDEIERRLKSGESINQMDTSTLSDDFLNKKKLLALHKMEMDRQFFNTQRMRGLHAAMYGRQLETVDFLLSRDADPTFTTADNLLNNMEGSLPVEEAAKVGFWEGIECVTKIWQKPLWPKTGVPADHLLISTIPKFDHTDFSQVSAVQKELVPHMIETFDYLLREHNLSIERASYLGSSFLAQCANAFVPLEFLEHVLKIGTDPNQEYVVTNRRDLALTDGGVVYEQTDEEVVENGTVSFAEIFGCLNPDRADQTERFETTPMIHMAYEGDLERVVLLLRHGGNPLYLDRNGNNALTAANEGLLDSNSGNHQAVIAALEEKVREMASKPPEQRPLLS